MADPQLPSVPPPPPSLVPWRQHFGELWRGGLRDDVVKAAVVIAVPAAIGGALWAAKKLWTRWRA